MNEISMFSALSLLPSLQRLLALLFAVPWQSQELLPQYSRVVATLSPLLPEMGPSLVRELQREFRYFLRKRPNSHLDMKVGRG